MQPRPQHDGLVVVHESHGAVLALLASGALEPQVARRFSLTDAAGALRYAESGGIAGKVILEPRL